MQNNKGGVSATPLKADATLEESKSGDKHKFSILNKPTGSLVEQTLLYSAGTLDPQQLTLELNTLSVAWGSRAMMLDKKGKLYSWNYAIEDVPKEINSKLEDSTEISKIQFQDLACSSQHLFLATESGEVIVANPSRSQSKIQENEPSLFTDAQQPSFKTTDQVFLNFFKLKSLSNHFISQISCGQNHAIFVTSSGFVYSFGRNNLGQLGQSKTTSLLNQTAPVDEIKEPAIIFQLLNLKVFSVACGQNHTIAIGTSRDTMSQNFQIYSSDNALFSTIDKNKTLVFAWGDNFHGQLGINDLPPLNDSSNNLPKDISSGGGGDQLNFIPSATFLDNLLDLNFKKVTCGNNHTILLEENGNLVGFGSNEYGQLGITASFGQDQRAPEIILFPAKMNEDASEVGEQRIQVYVCDVSCYQDQSGCVTEENEIYQWGRDIVKADIYHGEPTIFNRVAQLENINNPLITKLFGIPSKGFTCVAQENPQVNASHVLDNSLQSLLNPLQTKNDYQSNPSPLQPGYLPNSNNNGALLPTRGFTGISFTKEFQNLLQYIAVTAGNTRMPAGIKPMTFRPHNLPPKTQEEEAQHQRLVEENRQQYLQKIREKERQLALKRLEQEKKASRQRDLVGIWEAEILPNWDQVKRTKRVREIWIEGIPSDVRGRVWHYAFGNRSSITRELYQLKSDQGRKLRKLLREIATLDQEIADETEQVRQSINEEENKVDSLRIQIENLDIKKKEAAQRSPKVLELSKKLEKLKKKLQYLIGFDTIPIQTSLQSRERSISIIETDIPRTFPSLKIFQQGSENYEKLQRLLEAFAMHRPDIGYVQGMSYVAAVLLLYMEEHQAFVTFSNMITKYPIMPFFSFNDGQVKKILQVFKQVFQHNLPDLCEHLETENILPKQYVYEWFMTMFSRALNINLVSRIWDFYFLDGIFVLFQTAIAILRTLQGQLLREDFEGILMLLKNVPEIVTDEEQFVSYIYDVSFPKWLYDEIPQMESEYLKLI